MPSTITLPGVGRDQRGHHAQRGGLAGAVGPSRPVMRPSSAARLTPSTACTTRALRPAALHEALGHLSIDHFDPSGFFFGSCGQRAGGTNTGGRGMSLAQPCPAPARRRRPRRRRSGRPRRACRAGPSRRGRRRHHHVARLGAQRRARAGHGAAGSPGRCRPTAAAPGLRAGGIL
jgi:hypothetical protein